MRDHINGKDTVPIDGTFRGEPVRHYVDPHTGLNVITKPDGTFVSGWRLKPEQLNNVITRGKL